jgi:hypothetical protein
VPYGASDLARGGLPGACRVPPRTNWGATLETWLGLQAAYGLAQARDRAYSHISSRGGSPSPACWGRWREAPDGVWHAASPQVGLHERRREPSSDHTGFPHPIRPSATFPAPRRRGPTPALARSSRPGRGGGRPETARAPRGCRRAGGPPPAGGQSALVRRRLGVKAHVLVGRQTAGVGPFAALPAWSRERTGCARSGHSPAAWRTDKINLFADVAAGAKIKTFGVPPYGVGL